MESALVGHDVDGLGRPGAIPSKRAALRRRVCVGKYDGRTIGQVGAIGGDLLDWKLFLVDQDVQDLVDHAGYRRVLWEAVGVGAVWGLDLDHEGVETVVGEDADRGDWGLNSSTFSPFGVRDNRAHDRSVVEKIHTKHTFFTPYDMYDFEKSVTLRSPG